MWSMCSSIQRTLVTISQKTRLKVAVGDGDGQTVAGAVDGVGRDTDHLIVSRYAAERFAFEQNREQGSTKSSAMSPLGPWQRNSCS